MLTILLAIIVGVLIGNIIGELIISLFKFSFELVKLVLYILFMPFILLFRNENNGDEDKKANFNKAEKANMKQAIKAKKAM